MLTDTHFAFGLLISGVANVKRKGEGGWQVTSSKDKWEKLLRGVEVEDNILQDGLDLAEVSRSGVHTSKFVKVSEGAGKQGKVSQLLTVRLGQRVKGEAVVASLQFLHDVQPPANRGMRQQQRDLSNKIATMYKETYIEIEEDAGKLNELEEQIEAVKQWVDWVELKEDPSVYADAPESEEGGNDDDSSDDKRPFTQTKVIGTGTSCVQPGTKSFDVSKQAAFADEPTRDPSSKLNMPSSEQQSIEPQFTDEEKISLADVMIKAAQGNEEYMRKLRGIASAATLCQTFSVNLDNSIMSIPTPKTQTQLLYPPGHKNAKYRMLNSLNHDLMARDDVNGPSSRMAMDAVLGDIVKFKEDNKEDLSYKTWNNNKFLLQKLPVEKPLADSYRWLKDYKVIENAMNGIFTGDDFNAKIECMFDYLLIRYREPAKEALTNLGFLPKTLDVYEMSATMERCNIGITQWRSLVQCFKEFMNLDSISVSEEAWRELGSDVGEIKTGRLTFAFN